MSKKSRRTAAQLTQAIILLANTTITSHLTLKLSDLAIDPVQIWIKYAI